MMFRLVICFLSVMLLSTSLTAESYPVRLKEVAKIIEARDNALMGYGVVVGLRNSGDSRNAALTNQTLANMLSKLGISARRLNSRNIAAVMVTATLPSFIKKGQKIPVTVSSIGDSTSLVGGTLLFTELQGPDLRTYAVAQGPVIVGGISEQSTQTRFFKNQSTVGRIPDGATVEVEVPVTFTDQHNITIVLNTSSFISVSRAAESIRDNGFPGAQAIDANTIKVPLADLQSSDLVGTIATLEQIEFRPDESSKIVINARTGTIVIGEKVRLFPVAISHGDISIRISENAGGVNLATGGGGQLDVDIQEANASVILLNPASTLSSLVNALNEVGTTPKELISIIQALKEAGALVGEVEVI